MITETDCTSGGDPQARVERLPFSALPRQSKLFLDYIADPLSLQKYFPNAIKTHCDIDKLIPLVLKNYSGERHLLAEILRRQNQAFGASAKTLENIALLEHPETVAVLTGQQAGVFGGPLYTIYKAISAIRMASCLRQQGYRAVPVFWAATEDHDFDEVSSVGIVGRSGSLNAIKYAPSGLQQNVSVGAIKIDRQISETVNAMFSTLDETEFSSFAREMLEASYRAGETFGSAFCSLLSKLFSISGLIVVDPLDREFKNLAAPIYRLAVERSDEIVRAVTERSEHLIRDGYHAQVQVESDYFPLFWHSDDGQRLPLRRLSDDRFVQKDLRKSFSRDQIAGMARDEPERLSPGVLLRPVVQDFIFPTLCYFGGAAEIAYFAQNSEVYRVLGRLPTPVIHRQSFTVVSPRSERNIRHLGVEFLQLFQLSEVDLARRLAQKVFPTSVAVFDDVLEKVDSEAERISELLAGFDPGLSDNFAKRRKKIRYHIATSQKRFIAEQIRKDDIVSRRFHRLMSELAPKSSLQERSINVAQFLNEFGPSFIGWISAAADLSDAEHRLLHI